jgi:hypothetical protein
MYPGRRIIAAPNHDDDKGPPTYLPIVEGGKSKSP